VNAEQKYLLKMLAVALAATALIGGYLTWAAGRQTKSQDPVRVRIVPVEEVR